MLSKGGRFCTCTCIYMYAYCQQCTDVSYWFIALCTLNLKYQITMSCVTVKDMLYYSLAIPLLALLIITMLLFSACTNLCDTLTVHVHVNVDVHVHIHVPHGPLWLEKRVVTVHNPLIHPHLIIHAMVFWASSLYRAHYTVKCVLSNLCYVHYTYMYTYAITCTHIKRGNVLCCTCN